MKDTVSILWFHFRVRCRNHSWNKTPDIRALLSALSVPMSKSLIYFGLKMRFQGSISLEVVIILFELHPKLLYFILLLTFYHTTSFSNYTSANIL